MNKPTNPKDLVGSGKLPIHLWPATATALGSLGLLDGMLKYGRTNWRVSGVRASIYVDACQRHLNAWFEGEEADPDSGLPHLAHALACLAILVDAGASGKLTDDRMVAGGYRGLVSSLTPHVARLKDLHAGKDPKHYTIDDSRAAMAEHAAREDDARLIAESNAKVMLERQAGADESAVKTAEWEGVRYRAAESPKGDCRGCAFFGLSENRGDCTVAHNHLIAAGLPSCIGSQAIYVRA